MRAILAIIVTSLVLVQTTASLIGNSTLTKDKYCQGVYCVTAIYDPIEQHISYNLSVANSGPLSGWYAIGQGNSMSGANMMIAWVNSDSSVTTSQRSTTGHSPPTIGQVSAAAYTVNQDETGLFYGSHLNVSWIFPQSTTPGDSMAHMWAYSTSTPSSSRPDASISIHNSYTRFTLDFAQGITANATPSLLMTSASPSPTSPTLSSASNKSTISNTSSNVILAHMLCMVIAWMFLAPFGAIIARYGRTMFTWYPTHRAFQIGTLVLVIVGFSLGIAGVSKEGGRHFSQRHHQIGLIIFILLFVQCFLGQWAHSYRDKTGKRHICVIHMPLGIVLIGLSVWNTLTGFKLWSVQLTPNTPYFVYGWISLLTLVYIAGMYFVPQEITQARDAGISHQSEESVTLEKIHRHDTDRLSPIQEFDHYQQRRKFMILLEQDESVSNT